MKFSLSLPLRRVALLGAAAAALLCAGHVSAAPYTYEVDNYTFSGGDPVFPVVDDLTFNNLLITETYTDGFMQLTTLGSLDTSVVSVFSPATLVGSGTHGLLTSAILTGQVGMVRFPVTSTLDVSTQYAPGGPITDQYVFRNFSTSLFGTNPGGVSVGQFALLDGNDPVNGPVEIRLTPVPEATSAVSLGMLVLLGLGSLAVSRRRTASAK